MGKQTLFAAALASMTVNVNAIGSLGKCLDQEEAELIDISTVNYSMSWEVTLDPGDSCWHETQASAFATWEDGTDISVMVKSYRPPFGAAQGET